MIEYKIIIYADYSSEILERILRVIRHRKFEIYNFIMSRKFEENIDSVIIDIKIISKYPISLLYNQLIKLIYINKIKVKKLN